MIGTGLAKGQRKVTVSSNFPERLGGHFPVHFDLCSEALRYKKGSAYKTSK